MAETIEQLNAKVSGKVASSVKHFNSLITEYAKKAPMAMVVKLQRVLILEAMKRVILKTPVDTGKARGSWQIEIGRGIEGDVERIDKQGSQAQADAESIAGQLAGLDKFVLVTIFNNTPYILVLENGNSQQARKGIVRPTIRELRQIFP